MPRKPLPYPTDAELAILRALWQREASPVGVIHNAGKEERRTSYSTTLKMVQIMFGKGLLLRDESVRPPLYRPAASQKETQLKLVDDLVQKAFGGAAGRMLVRALSAKRISPEELTELKKTIRELEEGEP